MSRNVVNKKRSLINSFSFFGGYAIQIGVMFRLNHYLLKRISAEEYCILPLVNSRITFLPIFTTIFTSGICRYIIEAYTQHKADQITEIISTIAPFTTIAGIVILKLERIGLCLSCLQTIKELQPKFSLNHHSRF